MRARRILAITAMAATVVSGAGAVPVEAAPQCSQRECGPPLEVVEKIIRTCQYAYCQIP